MASRPKNIHLVNVATYGVAKPFDRSVKIFLNKMILSPSFSCFFIFFLLCLLCFHISFFPIFAFLQIFKGENKNIHVFNKLNIQKLKNKEWRFTWLPRKCEKAKESLNLRHGVSVISCYYFKYGFFKKILSHTH